MDIDYLIIGQGLAGSLLAWELIQRDCDVCVIDNGGDNASRIAAGLINPVTGKRFVKADNVDTLLPTAREVYRELSEFFKMDFFVAKPMLRVLRSQEEIEVIQKRLHDSSYSSYLGEIKTPEQLDYPLDNLIAALEQKHTGYLLTRPLLMRLQVYFIGLNRYRQATLDYREIELSPCLRWRDLKPKRIIFCEGHKVKHNPWFSKLPFRPAKGQILTLDTDYSIPSHILNYGNWLVPIAHNRFRIGATFERHSIDTTSTETGKIELLQALNQVNGTLAAASVVDQHANIRPCSHDRQPYIGHHPENPDLWIFNGFGAKGSLQIPWYSRQLSDTLLTGKPLLAACNINRI
ncbi:MAG: NAD(P)/FAD-dependent oxidoreductase [Gammaproteobacteria bacterium]